MLVVGPGKKIEEEEQNIMYKHSTQLYSMKNIDGTTDCNFNIGHATLSCLNSKNSMTTFEKSFVNCRNTIDDKLYSLTKKQYLSSPGPIDIDAEEKKIINNEIQKIKETNASCIYMYKQLPETCKKEGHCRDFWSKKIKHRNMVCDGLKFFDNPDVRDFCLKKESTKLYSMNNIDGTTDCNFNMPCYFVLFKQQEFHQFRAYEFPQYRWD